MDESQPVDSEPVVPSPLWLSHHRAEELDRCLTVRGRHICRRCSVLYPVALAVTVVSLALPGWPERADPVLLVLLPLPAVVEFCLEQLGRARYRPSRQVVLTVLLAIGLGRGFARYLETPTDPLFWLVVLVYGGACLAAVGWRFLDERAP